ncbi:MAG: phosphohydrolase [Bacteroidetes bacterium GWF2_40_14]|nr:MAG: phosphohydrolase [Bacteroidetes bacterium GWF2_40_14]
MSDNQIINQTASHIKAQLSGEGSGHDWWHVYRVWKNAIHIGKQENADMFVVELAALLHDIADWKFNDGNEDIGPRLAREWLESLSVDQKVISQVCNIVRDISFKGAGVTNKIDTLEGMVVQDADRLDAIGAIGICRTFAYGGSTGREIYNPGIPPQKHNSFDEYKSNKGPTINHFYEKLLLLKDLMNTATARKIATRRHLVMENFLNQFYQEWECKD